MLIVIAIIGILAAILFPVFGRVRENGRSTACSSNLKQLGAAFQQYLADNGGRFPGAGQYQSWGKGGHWVAGTDGEPIADSTDPYKATNKQAQVEKGAIYQYVKSPQVYVCPSNSDAEVKRMTYSMNCALSGLNQSRNTTPTDIILLVDEAKANDGYFWAADTASSTDAATKVHNGSANYLFSDYHVKAIPFAKFPVDKDHQNLKAIGTDPAVTTPLPSPRFHDIQFGPKGSSFPFVFGAGTDAADKSDSCGVKILE
jgi:type II secretory pathway pseudopilin PulG